MLVAVVVHVMAGHQGDLEGLALVFNVQNPEAAPGLLREHDLGVQGIHKRLDVAGLLFIRDQNALGAGGNHYIFQAHAENGDPQFVDHMDVVAALVEKSFAHCMTVHGFGEGIPGAQVFPGAGKAHDLDFGLVLHYCVVKADFVQGVVLVKQVVVIYKVDQLMGTFQDIAQLEGENAAVPQGALGDVLGGHILGGLLLEHGYLAQVVLAGGDDVAVFLAGIGRLDAHQDQVGAADSGAVPQGFQSLEVIIFHVGVHRANDNRFFLAYTLHVLQVGSGQGDGREGIPAAGLHADAHILAQLVVDGRNLGLGSGDGDGGIGVYRLDLAVNPLDHGFQFTLLIVEDLDELFGTNIVGKGPQALARTAGQQYEIHSLSPYTKNAKGRIPQ